MQAGRPAGHCSHSWLEELPCRVPVTHERRLDGEAPAALTWPPARLLPKAGGRTLQASAFKGSGDVPGLRAVAAPAPEALPQGSGEELLEGVRNGAEAMRFSTSRPMAPGPWVGCAQGGAAPPPDTGVLGAGRAGSLTPEVCAQGGPRPQNWGAVRRLAWDPDARGLRVGWTGTPVPQGLRAGRAKTPKRGGCAQGGQGRGAALAALPGGGDPSHPVPCLPSEAALQEQPEQREQQLRAQQQRPELRRREQREQHVQQEQLRLRARRGGGAHGGRRHPQPLHALPRDAA